MFLVVFDPLRDLEVLLMAIFCFGVSLCVDVSPAVVEEVMRNLRSEGLR